MHLLIIAVLPAVVLMFVIHRYDKVEREPMGLVLAVMGLGMLTTIPAIIWELLGEKVLSMFFWEQSLPFVFLDTFFVVALAEECLKRLVVRCFVWRKRAFNYRFDAIVYCVAASLGFALLENILYVFQYGFGTGITRAILSVPGHCTFGIFMGFFIGDAKLHEVRGNKAKACSLQILSLCVPVLHHGFYDFCLSMESVWLTIAFFVFVIAMDTVAIIRVIHSERQDEPFYILQEGDRWIQNPVWMQMAATSLNMEMPDIKMDKDYSNYPKCKIIERK